MSFVPALNQQGVIDSSLNGDSNNQGDIRDAWQNAAHSNSGNYLRYWQNVNPNSKEYASQTYANIIGAEYRDYIDRFQPYEQRVMELAQSRELLNDQLSRISANVNSAYKRSQFGAGDMMMQRYGIQQSSQGRASSTRQDDMGRALSLAHANNNTRLSSQDQRMGLVTGSAGARSVATNQMNGG